MEAGKKRLAGDPTRYTKSKGLDYFASSYIALSK